MEGGCGGRGGSDCGGRICHDGGCGGSGGDCGGHGCGSGDGG